MSQDFYLGNPNLKKVGTEIQFTKEQIQEYLRCKEDPVYFAMNYIKIISLDEGIVPFTERFVYPAIGVSSSLCTCQLLLHTSHS